MSSSKIKTGDLIEVRKGKFKGQRGKVLRVEDCGHQRRLYIQNLTQKKCVKRNPQQEQPGGIIDIEAPIAISNVALVNPVSQKLEKRVGFKILYNGKKVRFGKSSQTVLDATA